MSDDKNKFCDARRVGLTFDFLPCINYSMQLAKVPVIHRFELINNEDEDWDHVVVSIEGSFLEDTKVVVDCVPHGQRVSIGSLNIVPATDLLQKTTETVDTSFKLSITVSDELLLRQEYAIRLLPFDYWAGISVCPDLLSAFVTPNHPILSHVIVNASKFMEKWTGDSAMDAYETQDRNRARLQVAALYEALRMEGLVFVEAPASYEEVGQRVRLCDRALTEKLCNCLDATILMASCMEAVGLFPILVLIDGHAFVGAWLVRDAYSQNIGDDASFLLNRCADGINDIVLLEAVSLTASSKVSFEEAVKYGVQHLLDEKHFRMFIDVHHCRMDHLCPLPQRVLADGVWTAEDSNQNHSPAIAEISRPNHFVLQLEDNGENTVSRQSVWERKLLDFSLHNNLINTRLSKRIIPIVSYNIDLFEDCFQQGDLFSIQSFPGAVIQPTDSGMYDTCRQVPTMEQMVNDGLNTKRLLSYLSERELRDGLKFLYRSAKNSLEENGANSLFLAIGLLKWYENEKSVQPRYAPILLLPVDLVRRGAGYVVRSRDEEMILNVTLSELLRQTFDVNLKALNPLPTDEHGVDVKKVFAAMRQYIGEIKRWQVLEECLLGLFSFGKFVMWNDIHANSFVLKQNPIISSLLETRLKWQEPFSEVDAREMDKIIKPHRYAIPLDVDSSQLEAIVESGEGKSFILHGPPGTGKSQTITNMIANALFQGKKVLFVAEKKAALDVVQRRLAKIGLEPFCLELHSNKVTKQHFLQQMQMALNVAHVRNSSDYETVGNKLYEYRQKLIGNIEALHKLQPFGLSLYDCITRYLSIDGQELTNLLPSSAQINSGLLDKWASAIESLDVVFQVTGLPSKSPLFGIEPIDSRLEATTRLKELLLQYVELFVQYRQAIDKFVAALLPKPILDTLPACEDLVRFIQVLANVTFLTPELLSSSVDSERRRDVLCAVSFGRKRNMLRQQLRFLSPLAFKADVQVLRRQWQDARNKWFIPRFFATRSFVKSFRQYKVDVREAEVPNLLQSLSDYQQVENNLLRYAGCVESLFGNAGCSENTDWDKIEQMLALAQQVMQYLQAYANEVDMLVRDVLETFKCNVGTDFFLFKQQHADEMKQLVSMQNELDLLKSQITARAQVTFPTDGVSVNIPQKINGWLDNFHKIKDWCHWVARKKELHAEGIDCVIDYIEKNAADGRQAANALLKGAYHKLILHAIDADESLRMFNAVIFEDLIKRYRDENKKFQELTKQELYCRLAANVPNQMMAATQNSEMGILKRNINSGGRGTSIRKLIDQIPTLLPKLCPCMLMSPMSVAQFININHEKFDLVIFDEASQMPTSEAVGAIARGKSLVVVGDPLQMPPTSFFTSSGIEESEAQYDDMDSILEDCITLSMPSRYLTWHYRSKHESLIAFSNTQYYKGKLFTFPSVDNRMSKVTLVHVNGTYDKGRTRTNPFEARAIVDEVLHRLGDAECCKQSIGIVSFNKAQQTLIEDMLEMAFVKRPDLEKVAYDCEEPLFVKNLENVQGDERDVILFSIGYGVDKNGAISMNFGPLNVVGGERRLNVAVSRARYEMKVFSTLQADQIDLRRTNSLGVASLKRFLEFAGKGMQMLPALETSSLQASEVANQIAHCLRLQGYDVDTKVGKSGFRIDVAVVDSKNPNNYMLGILTDGLNYYGTKTTRDREICQPAILKMLGWNMLRVRSVEWFEHRDEVMERILSMLQSLDEHSKDDFGQEKQSAILPNEAHGSFEARADKADGGTFQMAALPEVSIMNDREQNYVSAQIKRDLVSEKTTVDMLLEHQDKVAEQVRRIVEVEQPVVDVYLYKRICALWNLNRASVRVQKLVDSCLANFYRDPMTEGRGSVYWLCLSDAESCRFYRINSKRDISETPIIELANAAMYAIEQQMSMPKEDLKRICASLLGFTRKGTNVDAATERAVQWLVEQNKLKDVNGRIMAVS